MPSVGIRATLQAEVAKARASFRRRFRGRPPPAHLQHERPEDGQGLGFATLGLTGIRRYGRRIDEEYDPRLRGEKAVRVYREMGDTSAVGGALLLIRSMLSQVELRWEPPEDAPPEAEPIVEFFEGAWNDLDTPATDVLEEWFSVVQYGFSLAETTYKLRLGPDQDEPIFRSDHRDGLVGWLDFEPRSADSVEEWVWEDNRVVGFWQRVDGEPGTYFVPLAKCLHFTLFGGKRSPEGRSLLRSAVRPNWMRGLIEDIEAIGAERNLDGLPIARVPAQMMSPGAVPAEKANLAKIVELVRKVRMDRMEGVVFPASEDPSGKKTGYDFGVLSTGVDPSKADPIIRRYRADELMALLCEFLALGTEPQGSRALASSQTSTMALAMSSVLKRVFGAFNGQEVRRLGRLNDIPVELLPKLVPGVLEHQDLEVVGSFVNQLISVGAIQPDAALEEHLRTVGALPAPDLDGPRIAAAGGADPRAVSARAAALAETGQESL